MKRRTFLKAMGFSAVGALNYVASNSYAEQTNMTAKDVNFYLRSICEVQEPSVDRIVIGDPNTIVSKIGTAWMPYWKTLREAVEQGVNTLIVHEPTFYSHWDLEAEGSDFLRAPKAGKEAYLKVREEKQQWIRDKGLVIIRCHDVLDKVPDFGIPYAFGHALGFSNADIIRSKSYYNIYKMETMPAIDVAKRIADKLYSLNQKGVAFYGDPEYPVKTIGLGTGCICNPLDYMELNADLYIGIDDTIRTWIQTTFSEDTGRPLIVINHGTSEEFGMRLLNDHLRKAFPQYGVEHFEQGCGYRWVTA